MRLASLSSHSYCFAAAAGREGNNFAAQFPRKRLSGNPVNNLNVLVVAY